jgi:autotransporter-associated beta strand protein
VGNETLTLNDSGSITMNSTVANNELFNAGIVLGTDATVETYTFTNNSTTNTLTFAGNISGGPTGGTAGTETLSFNGAGNIVIGGSLLNGGASQTLAFTKTGSGTLTFDGNVNAAILGSGAGGGAYGTATVNDGTLSLNFSNYSASGNANLLNSYTPIVLGGGTLQIIGNTTNASSQSFANSAGLTSNSGYDVVISGTSTNTATTPTLALGAFTQNVGSQTVFYGPAYNSNATGATTVTVPATGTITTTTATGTTGAEATNHGLLWNNTNRNGIATVGLYDWASTTDITGGASPYTILGGSQVTGFYTSVAAGGTANANDQNFDLLGNATANNPSNNIWYCDTLRFNATGAFTFTTNSGGSGHIALVGGILVTPNVGANNTTIANGGAYLAGPNTTSGANGALDVYQNNTLGELLFNVPFYYYSSNTRATSYVQGGSGTVSLTGQGTSDAQTGATYLNGGTTVINSATQLGTVAAVNLNGGTVFGSAANLSLGTHTVTLGGNGGGLASVAGDTMTVGGVISGGAGTGPLIIGISASAANGNVAGLVPGTGSIANGQTVNTANATAVFGTGTVILKGAGNSFYGGALIQGGATLNIDSEWELGGSNYSGLTFNGGILQYNTTLAAGTTVGTEGYYQDITANSATTQVAEPVTLAGAATIDTNGHSITYANSLGNYGTGGLIVISSTAGGNLTLNGANTYTGTTTASTGALILGGSLVGPVSTLTTGTFTETSGGSITGGSTTVSSAGATTLAGSNNYGGATSVTGGTLSLSGGITGSNVTVGGGTLAETSAGVIGGGSSAFAITTGTATLAGANTYGGGTTVSGGVVNVTNGSGSATGSGGVALNGGTLAGSGAISGTVTISGGILAPGAAGTILTMGGLTYNSGTLAFVLNGAGTGSGANSSISVTNATFTAAPTLSISAGNVTSITNNEVFTILSSTNAITGGSFLTGLPTVTVGRFVLTPSASGNNLILTANGAAANLVWVGGVAGLGTSIAPQGDGSTWNNTQTTGASNWSNGGKYDYFYDFDTVTFNDIGSPSHTVTLTTANSPTSVTVNTSSAYTFTGSGSITGPGTVTVQTGQLNLNIANSYSGGTNINAAGGITAGVAGALPSTGTVVVSGTLDMNGHNQSIGTLSDGGVSTGTITNGGTSLATLTTSGTSSSTYSGIIKDGSTSATALSVADGPNTLTLTGANTYSGGTTLTSGTLYINNGSAGSSTSSAIGTGPLTLNGGTINTSLSGLILGTNNAINIGGSFAFGGTNNMSLGTGAVSINGSYTVTLGGSGSTLTLSGVATNTTNAAVTTTVNGTGNTMVLGGLILNSGTSAITDTFNGSGNVTISGVVANGGSGANGLTYAGTGTLTLSGGDSQTGAINVSSGILKLAGGTVNGATSVTVANGAILNITGASVTLPGATGSPALNLVVGNSNPQIFVSGGSLTYGINAGGDQNMAMLAGTYTQTGGTVSTDESDMAGTAGNAATYTFYLGGGSYTSGIGEYANFTVGTRSIANAYVDGTGSLTVTGGPTNPPVGNFDQLLVGAQYSAGTAGTREFVQQGGTVNTNGLSLGGFVASAVNSPGVYYLNGGTLYTNALNRGNDASAAEGTGTLYFGGGTLASHTAAFTTDANVVTNINSGGAIFNPNNGSITFAGAIAAGTTGNVSGFTGLNGGSGYTADPTVTISGGGGTGATAVAIINASGAVTDIIITNPGSGYTSAPTFTIAAPASGTQATVASSTIATGNGGITVSGSNALILTAANTYTGSTTINPAATLQLGDGTSGHDGTISTSSGILDNGNLIYNRNGAPSSNLVISGSGTVTISGPGSQTLTNTNTYTGLTTINSGATLQLGDGTTGHDGTILNTSGITDNGALIYNRNVAESSGVVITGSGSVTISGPGSQTLTAANTYTGATTVNTGATLVLASGASLGDTSVTVGTGATLALQGNTIGVSNASLTLNGGSTLTLEDGSIDTVTLNAGGATGATIGSSAGSANLDFDFNNTASDELIVNNGTTAFGSGGGKIYLNDLASGTPASSYTIISDPNGGLGTSALTLSNTLVVIGGQNYIVSLSNSTSTAEIVSFTVNTGSLNYYWTGGGTTNNSSWSDLTNFATTSSNSATQTTPLSNVSNVFLTANTANNYTQTLDGNFAINSLSFTGGSTGAGQNQITLGPGANTANTLTLEATNQFTDSTGKPYLAGIGLVVQPGSAAHTISANINLGDNQTWEIDNSGANPLTVSGVIADGSGSDSLTKTGVGTLVLGNNETYSGGTYVTAGTLTLATSNALLASGALTVSGSGTLDLASNSQQVANLSDGGVNSGTITDSVGNGTLTIANSAADTFSGAITGGVGITVAGSSNVTISGSNTYLGSTTVTSGTLTATNNASLGNSTSSSGGLVVSPGAVVQFTSSNPTIAALSSAGTGASSIILGGTTGSGSATTLNVTGAGSGLIFNGTISDRTPGLAASIGSLTVSGGLLLLNAANTFTGVTNVTTGGAIELGNSLALQDSVVNLTDPTASLIFLSSSITLPGLTGNQPLQLVSSGASPVTLTIGNNNVTTAYTGNIGGSGSLIKIGTGSFTVGTATGGLSGGASYAGTTVIHSGNVILGGTTNMTCGQINVESDAGATNLTIQDDATINSNAELFVVGGGANPSASSLTVTGTASVTVPSLSLGNNTRGETINVTVAQNAVLNVNGFFQLLYNAGGSTNSTNTVNLNGGTLAVGNFTNDIIAGSSGTLVQTLHLNGGILEALAGDPNGSTFLPALSKLVVDVDTGGAIINTNGFNDTIAAVLAHGAGTPDGGLTKNGAGTLTLTGANAYSGVTTINAGVLNINGQFALGGANYGGITFNGGTLQYASTFPGTNGTADISANSNGVAKNVTILGGGATIDTNGNNATYANPIGSGGAGGLTKVGLGNLTLNGAQSYQGATAVNAGALTLASGASFTNPSPSITVANGAKLALTGNTIGASGASLILAGGSAFTMQDNLIDTVTLNSPGAGSGTVLTVGDSSAPSNLYFDFKSTGSDELIVNNGTTAFGTDGGKIYLTDLDAATPAANYTLISDPNGGLLAGSGTGAYFQLNASTITINGVAYSASLSASTNTSLILSLTSLSGVNYYWMGTNGTSWSNYANFATDHTGSTAQTSALNPASNVFLTADSPTAGHVASQTIDGNYTINSLSFTGTNSAGATGADLASITLSNGSASGLTINPANGFSDANGTPYSAGIGLVVQQGSAAHTVAANVVLGASQAWEIDNIPANGLLVTGTISDGGAGYAINKTGLGTLIVGGAVTYSGITTITNGTLQIGDGVAGQGTVSGNIVDNAALALDRSDDYSLGNTITGTGTLAQNGIDNVTLTAVNTFTGNTVITSGSLTTGNALALENSTVNYNNQGGTLSFGSLTAVTLGGLSGSALGQNLSLSIAGGVGVTLSVGNNNQNTTYSGILSGAGGLTKIGTGTLALGGANTIDGVVSINAGVLQISAAGNLGDASVNNTITFNGGTLESTANTYALGANQAITLVGAGTIQVDSGSALTVNGAIAAGANLNTSGTGSLTLSGPITGAGNITASGAGSLTLNGADTGTGTITVSAGKLILASGGSINGPTRLTVANGAILSITGASLTLPGATGSPALNLVVGNSNPQIFISGGSLTYGINAGGDQNMAMLAGTYTQTGGTVSTDESDMAGTAGNAATYTFYLGGGSYSSGVGEYANFTVGTRSLANAYVDGGTLTVSGGNTNPASGYLDQLLVGAQYSGGTAGTREFVQQNGTVNSNGLSLGGFVAAAVNSPGVYYLNGGTLNTNALNRGNDASAAEGTGTLDFGGGTLASNTAAFTTDPNVVTNVNSGGANFNTANGSITFAGAIAAGTTGNVSGFTGLSGGSGYTADPTVTITGGGGTGAAAVAIINASGAVTDIIITNPGSGYTSGPTFTIAAPASGTQATVTNSTIATGNGGIIVSGSNALILDAANTYTGSTTINATATLQLGDGTSGHDGTVSNTSGIVDNGTLIYNRFGSTSATYPITGVGAVAKTGPGSQTLTSTGDSYSGGTTVNQGTLIVSGNLSGVGAVNVAGGTLGGGGSISGAVTIATGATLAPGAGLSTAGTRLTLGAGLTLGSAANLTLNLDDTAITTDSLAITAGLALDPGDTDTLTLNLLNVPAIPTQQTYILATYSSSSPIGAARFGSVIQNGGSLNGYVSYDVPGGAGTDELTFTVVPEPGAWGSLLSGFGIMIAVQYVRRRRKL